MRSGGAPRFGLPRWYTAHPVHRAIHAWLWLYNSRSRVKIWHDSGQTEPRIPISMADRSKHRRSGTTSAEFNGSVADITPKKGGDEVIRMCELRLLNCIRDR